VARRAALSVVILTLLAAGLAAAGQLQLTRRDADNLQKKLDLITRHSLVRVERSAVRATTVSEQEVNAYLRYHAREELPVGLMDPYIWILGDGRLAGTAVVDLDAVRKQKERGWLDAAGYLTGRVPVRATGILKTQDGTGRFYLESAEIAGITVPKTVLQEIVSYYSRTPQQPQGVSLDAPFALPAAIREVRVDKGTAQIVQ
jgi:hypothetical protein